MSYTIIYMSQGREVGRERWTGRLAESQAFAENAVANALYERVEIRDADDRLVFQAPRAVRAAPS